MRRIGRTALLAATVPMLAVPAGHTVPVDTLDAQRVIIRLADETPRIRFLRDVIDAPLTLRVRHERIVEGLRANHDRSFDGAREVLQSAITEGALREIDRLWIVNAVVAEIDSEWIPRLEADPSILAVVPDRRLVLGGSTTPVTIDASIPVPTQPVDEMVRLRVDEVWAQGITGRGVIVSNTDSGVNGDDEDFGNRWRGRYAGADAAWYSPISLTVFPTDDDIFGTGGHGTATMGIMTGGMGTYGVAYDATWIAGDVFEASEGFVSNAIKAMEWLADPDGDPSTNSDVPDVVNNSYGIEDFDSQGRIRCDAIFNEAIDALEAAGAIVVWSAGNQGARGESTITSPANRTTTQVNAFAVGGIDANDNRSFTSSQGPSTCPGPNQTKPEVAAPSENVTSRTRFNTVSDRLSGTSFSTPMVAGILALMRSKDPTITPEDAKSILIDTARDLGPQGDDNETGHGIPDALEALARVSRPSQPLARLVGFERPALATKIAPAGIEDALALRPGGNHQLVPKLSNHGPPIPGTTATLTSTTPGVSITENVLPLDGAESSEFFGPADGGAFGVSVGAEVSPGADIVLDLSIQGAAIGPFRMVLKAGDPIPADFATHDEGQVRLTVTNFGGLGYYTGIHGTGFVLNGDGFRFPASSPNWLFHAGFLAGTDADHLSDGVPYGEDTQGASDWIPLPGFPIATDLVGEGQRIVTAYDDRRATEPLGLQIKQESFAFNDAGNDSYILLQFILTNTTNRTLAGVRAGLFADWDLPDGAGVPSETAGWDPARRLGFVEGPNVNQPALGLVWLDDVSLANVTYSVLRRDDILESTLGNPIAPGGRAPAPAEAPELFGGEFSDAEKWNALSSGQSSVSETAPQDLYQVIGVGPLTIGPGASDTVAVAMVAGPDRGALTAVAAAARVAYFERILGRDPPSPPIPTEEVVLRQNFPNPFQRGSQTTIPFALPESAVAGSELVVYDVSGRRVRTLMESASLSGEQAVVWDGLDDGGEAAPAGIYVVVLRGGGAERSIRVLLIP